MNASFGLGCDLEDGTDTSDDNMSDSEFSDTIQEAPITPESQNTAENSSEISENLDSGPSEPDPEHTENTESVNHDSGGNNLLENVNPPPDLTDSGVQNDSSDINSDHSC